MFQALRNRNIGLLFGAQTISIAGDLVLIVALPFWIYQLTGSAMATGFMFAALTLPQLFVSPIAGVFVDRMDRKRLMVIADLVRAALVACYLVVNTADQVWLIYIIAFAESAVSQFFRPAVTAIVPTLVDGEAELAQANATLGASWAIGQLGGPALGGILVAAFGPHAGALFDAGTYLLSAVFVLLIKAPPRKVVVAQLTGVGQAVSEITRELLQGVTIVAGRPVLRALMATFGFFALANGIINPLLVVMVNQLWHVGATELGWLISAQGIGGILGSVIVGAIAARVSPRAMMVGGGAMAGVLFLAIINQPSVYVGIAIIVFLGVSVVAFDVGIMTLLQVGSEDANRGRVMGLLQTIGAVASLFAIAVTSLLADNLGALLLLNIAGAFFILGGATGFLVPRQHDRISPQAAPAPTAD